MKAVLAVCILFVAGAIAGHTEEHNSADSHDHAPKQVCFKATGDNCEELKAAAKGIITDFKAKKEKIRNHIAAAIHGTPTDPPAESFPIFISKLQSLFNLSAQTDCHFEACKCKSGELKCLPMLTLLKMPLEKVKLPDCLNENEKAKEILTQFKSAINEGDRTAIVNALGDLRETLVNSLTNGDEDHTNKLITCLRSSAKEIKLAVKGKFSKLNLQHNCDFCTPSEQTNEARNLEIPVPVIHTEAEQQ